MKSKITFILLLASFALSGCFAFNNSNGASENNNSYSTETAPTTSATETTSCSYESSTTTSRAEISTATVAETKDVSLEGEWYYRGYVADKNNIILLYNEGNLRKIAEGYQESLGNVLDSYNSYLSIDKVFENTLRIHNPSNIRSDDGHLMGVSMVLTIDAPLHNEIYNYMKENNIVGSVTVLDAAGKTRAIVSYPSYDANADFTTLSLEPHACLNRCIEPARPGSTFKILSSVVAADYGINEYSDPGYLPTFDISNWDSNKKQYPTAVKRSLRQAFAFSSNCWYSQLFYDLGAEKVTASLDKYYSYSDSIECDFTVLKNQILLSTNSDLTRAGFGQRENISPLYIAMCANATVTGELNVPYIADKTVDSVTWSDIEQLGKKKTLSTIPSDLTEDVRLGMQDVAADLGLYVKDGVELYAKTGTAEVSDDGETNDIHYIVVTCTNDKLSIDNTQTIVLQYINSDNKYASGDANHMQAILNMIIK
ncbi:penicillin-binding transpeptidase domain-containing protein [Ruminococcus flavefaciens]|uniref:penicillin-binding transpeptidase domain-containing protein n=1 Tax=Ruminococcus flavefaciens TaxID=1265 RepID=UPI0026EFF842|nr:penicillin-binding transpeptidase domain-containing protein [Ruminococcus flavefaciens]